VMSERCNYPLPVWRLAPMAIPTISLITHHL
jgi:hypothetical protein